MLKHEDRLSDELSILASGMLGVTRDNGEFTITEELAQHVYALACRARLLEQQLESCRERADAIRPQAPVEGNVVPFGRPMLVSTNVLTSHGDSA